MIQEFPHFEKIELTHKDDFEGYEHESSDNLFVNLFCWGMARNYELNKLNNNIIIKNIEDGKACISILGNNNMPETVSAILTSFKGGMLKNITETQLKSISKKYKITEDRDNFDYVYLRKELVELAGSKFAQKRNHLNYFLNHNIFEFHELKDEFIEGCKELMKKWCDEHHDNKDNEVMLLDCQAALKCLDNYSSMDSFGAVILVEKKVIAFTIAEKLNKNTVVIHFEKANGDFRGAYQVINQLFAKNNLRGFKFINREQDLGDAGLRKSKLSYRPVDFVKKYRVSK